MADTIDVSPRETLGKAVKRLRKAGTLPANIYGRGITSTAVQMGTREALAMLRTHGLNNLINLRVAGEPQPRSVVVRSIKRHPATRELEHVDFFQVDLARTIQADVPVVIVGDAPAVRDFNGIVLHGAEILHVAALPQDIPAHIEVSVESLVELDQEITAGDVALPRGLSLITAPDVMIVRIAHPRTGAEGTAAGGAPAAS